MKQTAVEWLVEQILTEVQNYEDGDIENEWEEPFKHEYVNKYIGMIDLSEFVIKAKEIEKQQIVDFGYDIAEDLAWGKYRDKKAMEERYNEYLTFKQQEQ
jgi:hypothetical protein